MIALVAAIGLNNEIGYKNELIWRFKEDLKAFKARTTGHTVIMGRKTFESIGKPLPNRKNFVVGRNGFSSLEAAILEAQNQGETNIFIIGGAQIYAYAMKNLKLDALFITHIKSSFESADSFFPEIDLTKWLETSREIFSEFDFVEYKPR